MSNSRNSRYVWGNVSFSLIAKMAPGQVGTLTDERVDPIDLAATIVDVAQRGHLTIIELPRTNLNHGATEWTFERGQGLDELHSYERTLVDALAPADGEPVFVSRISEVLGPIIPQVQDQIYEEVVDQGWFSARPDVVRAKWSRLGTIAVVASLVALGLLVALVASRRPRRRAGRRALALLEGAYLLPLIHDKEQR